MFTNIVRYGPLHVQLPERRMKLAFHQNGLKEAAEPIRVEDDGGGARGKRIGQQGNSSIERQAPIRPLSWEGRRWKKANLVLQISRG